MKDIVQYFLLAMLMISQCGVSCASDTKLTLDIVGSWSFVTKPGDDGQRLEFRENGHVIYYWGRTRSETQSWNSEDFGPSERAFGKWQMNKDEILGTLNFGKEWGVDEGKEFLKMTGKLEGEKSMSIKFEAIPKDFKAWSGTESLTKE